MVKEKPNKTKPVKKPGKDVKPAKGITWKDPPAIRVTGKSKPSSTASASSASKDGKFVYATPPTRTSAIRSPPQESSEKETKGKRQCRSLDKALESVVALSRKQDAEAARRERKAKKGDKDRKKDGKTASEKKKCQEGRKEKKRGEKAAEEKNEKPRRKDNTAAMKEKAEMKEKADRKEKSEKKEKAEKKDKAEKKENADEKEKAEK